MELKVKGTIQTIGEIQTIGTGEKSFQKLYFTIDTGEQYDSMVAFEVFSQDKVEQFLKWNKVGDAVTVKFNIKTREYNGQYYTTLSYWRCEKDSSQTPEEKAVPVEDENDLPF